MQKRLSVCQVGHEQSTPYAPAGLGHSRHHVAWTSTTLPHLTGTASVYMVPGCRLPSPFTTCNRHESTPKCHWPVLPHGGQQEGRQSTVSAVFQFARSALARTALVDLCDVPLTFFAEHTALHATAEEVGNQACESSALVPQHEHKSMVLTAGPPCEEYTQVQTVRSKR